MKNSRKKGEIIVTVKTETREDFFARQQSAAPNPQLSSPAQPGTLPAQQPETPPIVTPPTSTETPIPRKISGSRG